MKTFFTLASACFLFSGSAALGNFNPEKNIISSKKSRAYSSSTLFSPPPSIGTGGGLRGTYYNGTDLSGTPLLTRVDSAINFVLTYSSIPMRLSPAPGIVPEDKFSVRWTGQVEAQYSETYTFYTQADDGIRLWVNGDKLIDNWADQGVTEKSGSITLVAGQRYDIKIEYYEKAGEATAKLLWSGPSTPKSLVPRTQLYVPARAISTGTGLLGTYYNDLNLAGTPVISRIDSTINFNFSSANQPPVVSPAPGIVFEDYYSVRWTGQVEALYNETYTFYALADDGVRLWVNGSLLVDNWQSAPAVEKSGNIALVAGKKYDIVLEYVEKTGSAVTKLSWSGASTPKAVIPKAQLYPPATGTGLQGVYYNGIALAGTPLLIRVDTTVNLELTYTKQPVVLTPAYGIVPEDKFSVRWSGLVMPQYSETYTFYTLTDDGARLWVNGELLVDNWNQGTSEKSGSIALAAGQQYDIVMEYFENAGEAISKLSWSSASIAKQVIPKSQLFTPLTSFTPEAVTPTPPTDTTANPVPGTMETHLGPNPVKAGGALQLAIQSPENAAAVISIWGINGNKVKSISLNLVKGKNKIVLNTAGMLSGVYVVAIQYNGTTINKKLVVQ